MTKTKIEQLLKSKIRKIIDWPKPGIVFWDITPLLEDKKLFSEMIDELAKPYLKQKIDKVVGIDARGFLLASAMAYKLKTGLAIIRKQGKLPSKTISRKYALEYGSNTIEMHQDSILPGEKIVIVDDVLATGGTMQAAIDIVKELKGKIIAVDFLIELNYLPGRKSINLGSDQGQTRVRPWSDPIKIRSLVKYDLPQISKKKEEKLAEIGIIGGSGFYEFFKENPKEIQIETEFGKPSDRIAIGVVAGKKVAFLPRHGKDHQIPPHKIPYRANISALKQIGVSQIIAPSAVGSLKKSIEPGDFVICDQFIDRTKKRDDTFFDGPKVAHIEMANPYCHELREIAISQAKKLNLKTHPKGTVAVIEGPKFSTTAESIAFSKMGCDVINMTQYPEVVLASEMGMCYLNISLVTDYDVGIYAKNKIAPVSIEQVLSSFKKNNEKLKNLILEIIKNIPSQKSCDCLKKSERMII